MRFLLSAIGGEPYYPAKSGEKDWAIIEGKARIHKVSTLVAKALREGKVAAPSKTAEAIARNAAKAAKEAFIREAAHERLKKRFEGKGLFFAVAKGPEIRRIAYPKDAAREYSDFDLVINSADYERFVETLLEAGCKQKKDLEGVDDGGAPRTLHWPAFEGDIAVELHPSDCANARGPAMLYENALKRKCGKAAMSEALEQLLYVCEHNILSHKGYAPLRARFDSAALLNAAGASGLEDFMAGEDMEDFKILLRAETVLLARLGLIRESDLPPSLLAYKVKSPLPALKLELITRFYGGKNQFAASVLFGPYGTNAGLLKSPSRLISAVLGERETAGPGVAGAMKAVKRALFYGGSMRIESLGIEPPRTITGGKR